VEIQVDDGPWQDTELAETVGPDTWRQWVYEWPAAPGDYELRVRATDADGRVQTDKDVPPFPRGASGLHTVPVKVRPE
jgi:hypothetical protein